MNENINTIQYIQTIIHLNKLYMERMARPPPPSSQILFWFCKKHVREQINYIIKSAQPRSHRYFERIL